MMPIGISWGNVCATDAVGIIATDAMAANAKQILSIALSFQQPISRNLVRLS
jgi:hypothetical protein